MACALLSRIAPNIIAVNTGTRDHQGETALDGATVEPPFVEIEEAICDMGSSHSISCYWPLASLRILRKRKR